MDTAQLIQSVRDGDYPKVATAVAIPAGHRALTVTPGGQALNEGAWLKLTVISSVLAAQG